MGAVFGVKDAADVGGDFRLEVASGDVGLGVLLEVELAALSGAGIEGVALKAARSPTWASEVTLSGIPRPRCLRLVKEVAPVDFGFREGAGDAEDEAFAVVAPDADGDEGGIASPPATHGQSHRPVLQLVESLSAFLQ